MYNVSIPIVKNGGIMVIVPGKNKVKDMKDIIGSGNVCVTLIQIHY